MNKVFFSALLGISSVAHAITPEEARQLTEKIDAVEKIENTYKNYKDRKSGISKAQRQAEKRFLENYKASLPGSWSTTAENELVKWQRETAILERELRSLENTTDHKNGLGNWASIVRSGQFASDKDLMALAGANFGCRSMLEWNRETAERMKLYAIKFADFTQSLISTILFLYHRSLRVTSWLCGMQGLQRPSGRQYVHSK